MRYKIYCDGSTKGNGQENAVGAWAYLVLDGDDDIFQVRTLAVRDTTNQRMELTAAIEALSALTANCHFPQDSITVYTDSAYLFNCYQQKWYENWQKNGWKNAKKQPVANQDLWEKIIPYFDTFGIDFVKVRGHNGDKWNEYVDGLAQTAAALLPKEEKCR